ncbi:uncharacterized protein LACBIDRAFT_336075 [Laccaria bicolor S238N-H82]|uniref:Predicted protein n=1 Tax=Laccaria bicolor (strain S238N-H82 / ATCC MYA-4686) TaxID=486041 RepID=B0E4B5_LACBS|nr:uncharacterized protein LACBIDRAFT_336075 [Laccaria bicolor S238N-H82]EDQ98315.1 predicted protein [Laccaria bicolor S238N-H82]|eukprot:XP_001891033.1 predicted protein [Laccaria bicolor S238N-H82]
MLLSGVFQPDLLKPDELSLVLDRENLQFIHYRSAFNLPLHLEIGGSLKNELDSGSDPLAQTFIFPGWIPARASFLVVHVAHIQYLPRLPPDPPPLLNTHSQKPSPYPTFSRDDRTTPSPPSTLAGHYPSSSRTWCEWHWHQFWLADERTRVKMRELALSALDEGAQGKAESSERGPVGATFQHEIYGIFPRLYSGEDENNTCNKQRMNLVVQQRKEPTPDSPTGSTSTRGRRHGDMADKAPLGQLRKIGVDSGRAPEAEARHYAIAEAGNSGKGPAGSLLRMLCGRLMR